MPYIENSENPIVDNRFYVAGQALEQMFTRASMPKVRPTSLTR